MQTNILNMFLSWMMLETFLVLFFLDKSVSEVLKWPFAFLLEKRDWG